MSELKVKSDAGHPENAMLVCAYANQHTPAWCMQYPLLCAARRGPVMGILVSMSTSAKVQHAEMHILLCLTASED